MDMRSLVPSFGSRMTSRRPESDAFLAFRGEMDCLFDEFLRGFGAPSLTSPQPGPPPLAMLTPQIDVSETDQEIQVTAELPGIDERNVAVTLADDMLTIRGETKAEREATERNYHLMERSRGTFSRSLRLPAAVDPNQVQAAFKNGVLTITIAKPKEAQERVHRIEVKSGEPAAADAAPSD